MPKKGQSMRSYLLPYGLAGVLAGVTLYHYTDEGSWWRYAAGAATILLVARGLYVR